MTAKIIAVFNQKGGSGKTMIAAQLAGTFGLRGFKVFVADLDNQATATFLWGTHTKARERLPATVAPMAFAGTQLPDHLLELSATQELILLDCPPILESEPVHTSLLAADLVLIPVPPSRGDVMSSLQAGEFAAKVRDKDNPSMRIAYVVNMMRRGVFHGKAEEDLRRLAQEPVLKSKIGLRAAFPESQARNCTVQWIDSRSSASQEIEALANEVAALIGLPKKRTKGAKK